MATKPHAHMHLAHSPEHKEQPRDRTGRAVSLLWPHHKPQRPGPERSPRRRRPARGQVKWKSPGEPRSRGHRTPGPGPRPGWPSWRGRCALWRRPSSAERGSRARRAASVEPCAAACMGEGLKQNDRALLGVPHCNPCVPPTSPRERPSLPLAPTKSSPTRRRARARALRASTPTPWSSSTCRAGVSTR